MQDYTLYVLGKHSNQEHDSTLLKQITPFTPFTTVITVQPQSYGDLFTMVQHRPQGEHTILLIDMDHTYIDLAVDLAVLLYEHTGIMPIRAYVHDDAGERAISVKYPAPKEKKGHQA